MDIGAAEYWPWIAIVSLGLFHGINPAMGWLFAVALGMHRRNQAIVLVSLVPIAIGHAAAVGLVVLAAVTLGVVVDATILMRVAGTVLLGFAAWHAAYGHRRRMRVGMQTGLAGLVLWSFLMANAHGAGLMLIPALAPICLAGSPAGHWMAAASWPTVLGAVCVHTIVMLATIAVVAVIAYRWAGVAFLRRGWINLDIVWTVALAACGAALLVG